MKHMQWSGEGLEAAPGCRWPGALLGAAAGVLALVGCDGGPQAPAAPAAVETPLVTPQGISLQGRSLQGMSLQGMSLQGRSLQGMSLQGMSLQGRSLQGVSLQGTSLQGLDADGQVVLLAAGDELTVTDLSGASWTLRIADWQKDASDPDGDVTLYLVELRDEETGKWLSVCGPDALGESWAIPLSGYWDETGARVEDARTFTFGCTSGVLAKCVRWGYKPWKTVRGQSLAPYHQACTRMARADYCGDGRSHTLNGTLIDMYDNLDIQTRASGPDFFFEAEWTPDGAHCVSKERWQGLLPTGDMTLERAMNQTCQRKLDRLDTSLVPTDECSIKVQPTLKGQVVLYNRSRLNVAPAH